MVVYSALYDKEESDLRDNHKSEDLDFDIKGLLYNLCEVRVLSFPKATTNPGLTLSSSVILSNLYFY